MSNVNVCGLSPGMQAVVVHLAATYPLLLHETHRRPALLAFPCHGTYSCLLLYYCMTFCASVFCVHVQYDPPGDKTENDAPRLL